MTIRHCYTILHTQFAKDRGYVPSLVVEGEAGHSPMTGQGECSQPWYWGMTYDEAKRTCDDVNLRSFGLTPADAADIVASSIAAQHRDEARGARARVRIAEKLGRQPDPADRYLAERG